MLHIISQEDKNISEIVKFSLNNRVWNNIFKTLKKKK